MTSSMLSGRWPSGLLVALIGAVAGLVVMLWPAPRRTMSDAGSQPVGEPAPVG